MQLQENKNSFFLVFIDIINDFNSSEGILNDTDVILAAMNASFNKTLRYENNNSTKLVILFGLEEGKRKRSGQLVKLCAASFNKNTKIQSFTAVGITKSQYFENQRNFSLQVNQNNLKLIPDAQGFYREYSGKDIQHLITAYNSKGLLGLYPWQRSFVNNFFNVEENTIKESSDRFIYNYIDLHGNSGKSSLIKTLRYLYSDTDICQISISSTSQLRSSLAKIGPRRLYLLDLPRELEKTSSQSMNSVVCGLEDVKNGSLQSSFYGTHTSLLMDIPHVIVFSNYAIADVAQLSLDRWRCFEILKKTKTLGKLNALVKKKGVARK